MPGSDTDAPPAAPLPPTIRPPLVVTPDVIGLFPEPSRAMIAPMSVAIVDYGSGNLHSAAKAFERAAREAGTMQPIVVTRDPDAVRRAERVVLPGVGAFADCRRGLDAVPGMVAALEEAVRRQRPAVPRHLRRHAAHGRARPRIRRHRGPRLDPGEVDRIAPSDPALKIPHMGWNTLTRTSPTRCSTASGSGPRACTPISCTPISSRPRTAPTSWPADYGGPVTAMVARDNIAGTQFHPEKSQKLGLALIANFLRWKP